MAAIVVVVFADKLEKIRRFSHNLKKKMGGKTEKKRAAKVGRCRLTLSDQH